MIRPLHVLLIAMAALPASAQLYKTELFLPGSGMHGIHGLAFDSEDRLYAGSVIGQSIYEINAETGQHRTYVGPPLGMADDLEFGEDGTLFWTSFALGKVHAQKNFGPTREIASGLIGINSLAFNDEGRLFATQVFLGDALWELDPLGNRPPRKILEKLGGLNGFDFGPDGYLYGPLWFKGAVARVDVDSGELEVIMDGFKVPAAVNFDSKGDLWVLDSAAGQIVQVDVEERKRVVYPGQPTAMDNLAFDSNDTLWFTVMAENAVYRFDPDINEATPVRRDPLAQPCDLHIVNDGGRELLYVADNFAVKCIDLQSNQITSIARNVESHIAYPSGLFASDRHLLLTSWFSNTVQVLDRKTGEMLKSYAGVAGATDALETAAGEIFVLRLNGALQRVEGDAPAEWSEVARVPGGVAITYGGGDRAYVASQSGTVYELNLATGETSPVVEDLAAPEGLALTPEGNLAVVETGKDGVAVIDLENSSVATIGAGIPSQFQMPPLFPTAGPLSGLAVASDGTIYVTSVVDGSLFRLTPLQATETD